MAVYVGITVGYGSTTGSTEGFSTYDPKVWKGKYKLSLHFRYMWISFIEINTVPVSINFIWAGLFLIGTFFVKESPRALAKNGKTDEALQTLAWYRGMSTEHAYVQEEFSDILEENLREQEAMHGKNLLFRLKLLFTTRANLYRLFMIGIAIQILGQWSGESLTLMSDDVCTRSPLLFPGPQVVDPSPFT